MSAALFPKSLTRGYRLLLGAGIATTAFPLMAQPYASNVADRKYIVSGEFYCYHGGERSVADTLSYRW